MQKLVFTNGGGQTIDLTSGNFGITNWEGLSNTDLNIQTQQVPFQDGAVFLDALMEPREISVTVAIQDNNDLSARYELKRQLISALNPKLGEGVLVYTNDYLSRQIKAVPQLPIFENKNSNDAGTLKASVVFSCPSPYWEDLEETIIYLKNGEMQDITNNGDLPILPKLEYLGAGINPKTINYTTGKKIEITGTVNNVEINTEVGNKTVDNVIKNYNICNKDFNIRDVIKIKGTDSYYINLGDNVLKTSNFEDFESQSFKCEGANAKIICSERLHKAIMIQLQSTYPHTMYVDESQDYTSWTRKTQVGLPNDMSIVYETYAEELALFVLFERHNIYTSTDGITWTSRFETENAISSVCENNGVFVFVLNNGQVYSSSDLMNWTLKSTLQETLVQNITYFDSNYIVLMSNRKYYKSQDLISWEMQNINIQDIYTTYLVKQNQIYILLTRDGATVPQGIIFVSSDLLNWEQRYENNAERVKYLELGFYVFYETFLPDKNLRSYNLINFYDYSRPSYSIVYSKKQKLYVGISRDEKIYKSYDLKTWIKVITPFDGYIINDIVYSEKKNTFYVLIINEEEHCIIYMSSDLIHWQSVDAFTTVEQISKKMKVIDDLNKVIILGEPGILYVLNTEDNSITSFSIDTTETLYDIDYGQGKYVVVGTRGYLADSNNLIDWNVQTGFSSEMDIWVCVYSKEIQQFAIAGKGISSISNNGRTWQKIAAIQSGQNGNVIFSKTYNNFVFDSVNGVWFGGIGETHIRFINFNLQTTNFKIIKQISFRDMVEGEDNIVLCGEKCIINVMKEKRNIINRISNDTDLNFKIDKGVNSIISFNDPQSTIILDTRITFRQKYIGV